MLTILGRLSHISIMLIHAQVAIGSMQAGLCLLVIPLGQCRRHLQLGSGTVCSLRLIVYLRGWPDRTGSGREELPQLWAG